MFLCYVDESGTSEVPGNTSHFVLAGVAIPIARWRVVDQDIRRIADGFGLGDQELHTAWLLRPYLEQRRIANFARLDREARRAAVTRYRNAELLALQKRKRSKSYDQVRKNYAKTDAYVHLTFEERQALVRAIADQVGAWDFAHLFAECIDKLHFDPKITGRSIDEQAFEQIVSRFERFLLRTESNDTRNYGLIIHDHNQTIALKHTSLMRRFHATGTLWTEVDRIIETPMFVDSKLTSMVQVADLCSYALRRYVENREEDLFERVMRRADRHGRRAVGVRHFTVPACRCLICQAHRG